MPVVHSRAVGLGLRRALLEQTLALPDGEIDFVECAPENWIGMGGRFREMLEAVRAKYPITCHGLSLSLGGITPFDRTYLADIRRFLEDYAVPLYSEHLSYCSDGAQLYDLLPIPFTDEAVRHVGARIREVQDALGRRIAVENVSYYAPHPVDHAALTEPDFICAVVEDADCDVLLDVNNLYVNFVNHGTDPGELIRRLPAERIASFHVAGHYDEAPDLKIDSHGAPVKRDVWDLLTQAYARIGHRPTLLERDFNFGDFRGLRSELAQIRGRQAA